MKMTRFEKYFVNRKKKSQRNIEILESQLKVIDLLNIRTVLEVGCGIGFVSSYLAENYNFDVCGTDYDREQIQIAEKIQPKHEHLSFRVENAAKLTFADSSIDLVVSQNVFHHIPGWEDAIKEISRVLRSGADFVWADLTFPKPVKNFFLPFTKNYGLYTIEDITIAFKFNGFNILSHEKTTCFPLCQHIFVLQKK